MSNLVKNNVLDEGGEFVTDVELFGSSYAKIEKARVYYCNNEVNLIVGYTDELSFHGLSKMSKINTSLIEVKSEIKSFPQVYLIKSFERWVYGLTKIEMIKVDSFKNESSDQKEDS